MRATVRCLSCFIAWLLLPSCGPHEEGVPDVSISFENTTTVTVQGTFFHALGAGADWRSEPFGVSAGQSDFFGYDCDYLDRFYVEAEFYVDPLQGGPTTTSDVYELGRCTDSARVVTVRFASSGSQYSTEIAVQ